MSNWEEIYLQHQEAANPLAPTVTDEDASDELPPIQVREDKIARTVRRMLWGSEEL